MAIGVISVRYARALLKCAMELNLEDKVYQEMITLADQYNRVPELRSTIDNPMLEKNKKQALLQAACGKNLSELTARFIQLVLQEGRENVIQMMATSYITLYRKQKNIISGRLITATTVTSEVEQKMKQMVQRKSQGTVEFQTEVDPDIIGGFILEYDSYRMDASVQTKLNNILKELKK
ncbi:F0F1 ATP synthase subunit delta [Hoylesella buccalis]|uniref:ATP synthase subunit delta n=1 Tax=Hoylesella buccalis DNF00853 TaxID=1401074 RepID=A0A095ZP07_9BACT|nr:F0F1 ATP synthase subunit delta [Hoylesella buccalis]KGF36423.1 ATP synthase F0F1 subunit delta [Hoylesella buccalis DNF00853]